MAPPLNHLTLSCKNSIGTIVSNTGLRVIVNGWSPVTISKLITETLKKLDITLRQIAVDMCEIYASRQSTGSTTDSTDSTDSTCSYVSLDIDQVGKLKIWVSFLDGESILVQTQEEQPANEKPGPLIFQIDNVETVFGSREIDANYIADNAETASGIIFKQPVRGRPLANRSLGGPARYETLEMGKMTVMEEADVINGIASARREVFTLKSHIGATIEKFIRRVAGGPLPASEARKRGHSFIDLTR